ncbi:uncharacterized protein [Eurosta solidaginis]|uniref:uncharacterized protein n=1 Tax=Eurosta solidaginis TaxID=178769 RepID=UPI003530B0D1
MIKTSVQVTAMEGEIGTTNTAVNHLQYPAIQEPILKATEQAFEPEAAEPNSADHVENMEYCNDLQSEFGEFIKNEPTEIDEPNSENGYDNSMHSTVSVKSELLTIECEEQQISRTSSKHVKGVPLLVMCVEKCAVRSSR